MEENDVKCFASPLVRKVWDGWNKINKSGEMGDILNRCLEVVMGWGRGNELNLHTRRGVFIGLIHSKLGTEELAFCELGCTPPEIAELQFGYAITVILFKPGWFFNTVQFCWHDRIYNLETFPYILQRWELVIGGCALKSQDHRMF